MQSTQQTIFDAIRESRRNPKLTRAPRMATQVENIERVQKNIGDFIVEFFLSKQVGDQFHDQDLWQYVNDRHRCAPASPRRILAQMAKDGKLGYELLSRPDSLFAITQMPEAEKGAA